MSLDLPLMCCTRGMGIDAGFKNTPKPAPETKPVIPPWNYEKAVSILGTASCGQERTGWRGEVCSPATAGLSILLCSVAVGGI